MHFKPRGQHSPERKIVVKEMNIENLHIFLNKILQPLENDKLNSCYFTKKRQIALHIQTRWKDIYTRCPKPVGSSGKLGNLPQIENPKKKLFCLKKSKHFKIQ